MNVLCKLIISETEELLTHQIIGDTACKIRERNEGINSIILCL